MSAATQTGAELRVWRERLGLSEAWIEDALDETPIPRPFEDGVVCGNGYGETRRLSAEGDGAYGYYEAQIAVLRTAYAAAQRAWDAAEPAPLEDPCEGMALCPRCHGSRVDPLSWRCRSLWESDECGECSGDGVVPCAGCDECAPNVARDEEAA